MRPSKTISLKSDKIVKVHGAVSVVMAYVEEGQAATNEDKAHMCTLNCISFCNNRFSVG